MTKLTHWWKQVKSVDYSTGTGDIKCTLGKPVRGVGKVADSIDGASIWVVDGNDVKVKFDMDFVEGGNHCVYKFIPPNQIWIDSNVNDSQKKFIALHEVVERHIMVTKHVSYEEAHKIANWVEKL